MTLSRSVVRTAAMLLMTAILTAGCGRMIAIDYEPTNPWKGQGAVAVSIFRYDAAEAHRVRPREVETSQAAKTELFLSQEIGAFFADALRRELVHAGYTTGDSSPLSIWGSVARFYADWKLGEERVFE